MASGKIIRKYNFILCMEKFYDPEDIKSSVIYSLWNINPKIQAEP